MEKAGVEGNELHIYPYGGHGYGMRKNGKPVSDWPSRAALWMKTMGGGAKMSEFNQAVRYHQHGKPKEVLKLEELTLRVEPREVRIEIQVSTIHPSDYGLIQEVMKAQVIALCRWARRSGEGSCQEVR